VHEPSKRSPGFIINWDITLLLLANDEIKEKLRLAPGSKKSLRRKGLNSGSAPPKGGAQEKRSLQLDTLISPAGNLDFTAIMIAKRTAKDLNVHLVYLSCRLSKYVVS
jgi:hypothetical protein